MNNDLSAMGDDQLTDHYIRYRTYLTKQLVFPSISQDELVFLKFYVKYMNSLLKFRGIEKQAIEKANIYFNSFINGKYKEQYKNQEEKQN